MKDHNKSKYSGSASDRDVGAWVVGEGEYDLLIRQINKKYKESQGRTVFEKDISLVKSVINQLIQIKNQLIEMMPGMFWYDWG